MGRYGEQRENKQERASRKDTFIGKQSTKKDKLSQQDVIDDPKPFSVK